MAPVSLMVGHTKSKRFDALIDSGAFTTYFHSDVGLAEHIILIKAGFYDRLGCAGILGRHGFFEHFAVTFDPSNNPPGMDISRIHRA